LRVFLADSLAVRSFEGMNETSRELGYFLNSSQNVASFVLDGLLRLVVFLTN
jgi:hypothetical protein